MNLFNSSTYTWLYPVLLIYCSDLIILIDLITFSDSLARYVFFAINLIIYFMLVISNTIYA